MGKWLCCIPFFDGSYSLIVEKKYLTPAPGLLLYLLCKPTTGKLFKAYTVKHCTSKGFTSSTKWLHFPGFFTLR